MNGDEVVIMELRRLEVGEREGSGRKIGDDIGFGSWGRRRLPTCWWLP
jgi:hypothetical protein